MIGFGMSWLAFERRVNIREQVFRVGALRVVEVDFETGRRAKFVAAARQPLAQQLSVSIA